MVVTTPAFPLVPIKSVGETNEFNLSRPVPWKRDSLHPPPHFDPKLLCTCTLDAGLPRSTPTTPFPEFPCPPSPHTKHIHTARLTFWVRTSCRLGDVGTGKKNQLGEDTVNQCSELSARPRCIDV